VFTPFTENLALEELRRRAFQESQSLARSAPDVNALTLPPGDGSRSLSHLHEDRPNLRITLGEQTTPLDDQEEGNSGIIKESTYVETPVNSVVALTTFLSSSSSVCWKKTFRGVSRENGNANKLNAVVATKMTSKT
jgi:hypothetical protein